MNSILFWFVSRVKRPVCKFGHSTAPGADVKNKWRYTSVSPVFLHGVDRHNFTSVPSIRLTGRTGQPFVCAVTSLRAGGQR